MKIIDEKGKLFGKINIIDFLAVLFLLSLLPMFYFGYRLSRIKPPEVEIRRELIEIELPCVMRKIPPETLKLIKVGDAQIDDKGKKIGEIINLGKPVPYNYRIPFFPTSSRDYLIKEDGVLKEVPATLRLIMEVKENNKIFYNQQPVFYEAPFDFTTAKYSVEAASILQIPEETKPRRWVKVKVRFSGLVPELCEIINGGHIEKDSEGKIIGRIDEILERQASQIQALKLEESRLMVINDPFRKDLTAALSLLCVEDESGLYFKNYPVKIGSQINFSSKFYIVSGTIIDINFDGYKNQVPANAE